MGAIISAPASELPDRVDRATAARLAGAAFDEARWAAAAGADGCVGRDELLAAGAAAPADAGESATLRFIHVNDIYDLASLPRLATLVAARGGAWEDGCSRLGVAVLLRRLEAPLRGCSRTRAHCCSVFAGRSCVLQASTKKLQKQVRDLKKQVKALAFYQVTSRRK